MENNTHREHEVAHKSHDSHSKALSGPLTLLEQSWNFYVTHWKVLVALSLSLFLIVFATVFVGVLLGTILIAIPMPLVLRIIFVGILALAFVGFLVYVCSLIYGAQIRFLVDQSKQKFMDRIKAVRPYFWGMVAVQVLLAFVGFGGYILFIIPGIYLAMMLHFALFIYFEEGKKGFDALGTSFSYARGNFWALFWRAIVLGVLLLIVFGLIALVLSGNFANLIVNVIGAPIVMNYYWKMYQELKAMHTHTAHQKTPVVFKVLAVLGGAALVLIAFFVPFFLSRIPSDVLEESLFNPSDMERYDPNISHINSDAYNGTYNLEPYMPAPENQ